MGRDVEHSIRILASYDYRDDPNDTRGAHGTDIMLVTKGPAGAITCRISTGWVARPLARGYLRGADRQQRNHKPGVDAALADCYPTGAGIASHSATQDRDYWSGPGPCDVLGGFCYGDTGFLVSDDILLALVEGGDEAAFAKLDEFYAEWLGPEPVERAS